MARSNLIVTIFYVITSVFSFSTHFCYAKSFGSSLSIILSSELASLYFVMYNIKPCKGTGFLTYRKQISDVYIIVIHTSVGLNTTIFSKSGYIDRKLDNLV